MKKLLIIGCGNVGGFIANNLDEFLGDRYSIEGFLDDDVAKVGKSFFGYKVLGGIAAIEAYTEEIAAIVCVSNPGARKRILEKMAPYTNVLFPPFLSRHAWFSNNIKIGKGVIVYPGAAVNYNTHIQDFSIINMNCAVGHDCIIGFCSTLAPSVSLAGFTHLGECVEMCIHSATVQGTQIGENSIVGGMGMVTRNLPANCTAVGVPAKPIKYHESYVPMKSVG